MNEVNSTRRKTSAGALCLAFALGVAMSGFAFLLLVDWPRTSLIAWP